MKPLAFVMAALVGAAMVALAGPVPGRARETQLAGVQLGKPAATVAKAYGSPTRVQVGMVTAPMAQALGMSGMPGMEGAEGASGMLAPGMPGMAGGMAPGMPGVEGGMMPGGMMPGGMMPGGMMPGGAPPGLGMPGGEAAGGMPGMEGAEGMFGGQQAQMPQHVHWVYERDKQGTVLIFGFDEEGRTVSVTVGDGYRDSVNRGGTRRPTFVTRTARGIGVGDAFRRVISAYGYPETQQSMGTEVVLTYYDKAGVAFAMKQGVMKVTSITIREMPESK